MSCKLLNENDIVYLVPSTGTFFGTVHGNCKFPNFFYNSVWGKGRLPTELQLNEAILYGGIVLTVEHELAAIV
jgi:hypothetical protein